VSYCDRLGCCLDVRVRRGGSDAFQPPASVACALARAWINPGNPGHYTDSRCRRIIPSHLYVGKRRQNRSTGRLFRKGPRVGWTDEAGVSHAAPSHNCMSPITWFLPMLSVSGGQQPAGVLSSLPSTDGSDLVVRRTLPAPSGWSGSELSLIEDLGTVDLHSRCQQQSPHISCLHDSSRQ
jgi:hypothetical protein